ncbi:MAG: hypothetical protein COA96_11675 [SAR86 cluster bacterium]|uniref:EAL domain-containing protein n=1 Tax=SAR86 cluster bacterium TaxID=2030880 RepID=A0A2A5AW73_9GAMM|nr:MAG: hypothetical protein COA96_11675 [SAR86 cluster bacterium]
MNAPTVKPTLLVADDEIEIGEIFQAVAEDLGFDVTCVTQGSEVVDMIERIKPDVVALDLRMPGADGVEIIRELGSKKCRASFILMSGLDQRTLTSVQSLGREANLEINNTMTKPMSVADIEATLSLYLTPKEENHVIQAAKPEAPAFDYGLKILYEPEFLFKAMENSAKHRLQVCAQWRRDDGSILAGLRFSNWGKEAGISKGLAEMVLTESLQTLHDWTTHNFSPEIAIHLDADFLADLSTPDVLSGMVDKFDVPRELLAIEIDESYVSNKKDSVNDVLTRLRIKGFRLSVFIQNEGEVILPMLDSLPVDQIVVDMSSLANKPNFLEDMETEFLYSSLTSVAKNKGITACATNVNTKDQFEFVQRCNFNSARGTQILSPGTAPTILPLYTDGKFA